MVTVVGVIGVMLSLEVIKIMTASAIEHRGQAGPPSRHPSMTIFAAFDNPQWRTFRMRPKKDDCIACGRNPSITSETIATGYYETLCVRSKPKEIVDRVSVEVDS
jgi:adenylyltransferase/sulfurtransferase